MDYRENWVIAKLNDKDYLFHITKIKQKPKSSNKKMKDIS